MSQIAIVCPASHVYSLDLINIIATSERAPASELGATLLIFGWASCVSDASLILDLCFSFRTEIFFIT